jgi:hypothetical protein
MVHFVPLNIKEEDTITRLLYEVDNALQYFEDQEVFKLTLACRAKR